MRSFGLLTEPIKGGLVLWLLIVFLLFFFNLIVHLFTDRKAYRIIISTSEMTMTFVLLQLFLYQLNKERGIFTDTPVPAVLLLDIVLTIGAVFDIVSCLRRRARELTLMSVKECMDELPVGICFYRDGGLTKLTNLKMESIAQRLTGATFPTPKVSVRQSRRAKRLPC